MITKLRRNPYILLAGVGLIVLLASGAFQVANKALLYHAQVEKARQVAEMQRAKEEAKMRERLAFIKRQHDETEAMVKQVGERLSNDKSGTVYRRPGVGVLFDLTECDVWGHQLRVVYGRHTVSETLTLRSAGPDGLYNTDDDIMFETSAYTAAGAIDGAGNIIREHMPSIPKFGNPFRGKTESAKGKPHG